MEENNESKCLDTPEETTNIITDTETVEQSETKSIENQDNINSDDVKNIEEPEEFEKATTLDEGNNSTLKDEEHTEEQLHRTDEIEDGIRNDSNLPSKNILTMATTKDDHLSNETSSPFLLLESKTKAIDDDSVFSGDFSRIPDQILAEPMSSEKDELDERTENEIASNIEDQLKEFEGSEDESNLPKDNIEIKNLEVDLGDSIPNEIKSNKISSNNTETTSQKVINLLEDEYVGSNEAVLSQSCNTNKEHQDETVVEVPKTDNENLLENPISDSSPAPKLIDDDKDDNVSVSHETIIVKKKQSFEEVDVSMNEKEKSAHLDETDVLSEDQTRLSSVREEMRTPIVEEESVASISKSHSSMEVEEDLSQLGSDLIDEDKSPQSNSRILEKSKEEHLEKSQEELLEKNLELEDVEMHSMDEKENIIEKESFETDPLLKNDQNDKLEQAQKHDKVEEDISILNDANDDRVSKHVSSMDEGNSLLEEMRTISEVSALIVEQDEDTSIIDNADGDSNNSDGVQTEENASVVSEKNSTSRVDSAETIEGNINEKIIYSTNENSSIVDLSEEQDDSDHRNETNAEETCLLPDSEHEITEDEKQRAIRAREIAEKEISEGLPANKKSDVQVSKKHADIESHVKTKQLTKEVISFEEEQSEILDESENNEVNDNVNDHEIKELSTDIKEEKCIKCRKLKPCNYKFLKNNEIKYLCDLRCVHTYRTNSKEKYTLIARKVIITSIVESKQECFKCKGRKNCRFRFKNPDDGSFMYLCDNRCLNFFIGKNIEKYLVRRKKYIVEEILNEEQQNCIHCNEIKLCRYYFKQDEEIFYICHEDCFNLLEKEEPERFRLKRRSVRVRDLGGPSTTISHKELEQKIVVRSEQEAEAARVDREASFVRRCAQCFTTIEMNEKTLQWETLDFCNELCLGKYQNIIGSSCTTCTNKVPIQSLGRYCVRFGFELRQFCCSSCLDSFKKGLKVCSCCQKDISTDKDGFLAPVGDKGQFKDFCSQSCMKRYDEMCNFRKKQNIAVCAVCNNEKLVRVDITLDNRDHCFCSNPCFSAFKFVNNIYPDQCTMCSKYFERKCTEAFTVYQDKTAKVFCCRVCMNIYITMNRKIVPCQWCKVKKYNFDMIQKQCGPQILMLCSLNCLTLYGVSLNAISMRTQKCDQCNTQTTSQYHLTMSDTSVRHFCTYQCVMAFQSKFGRTPIILDTLNEREKGKTETPFPTGLPKRVKTKSNASSLNAVAPTKITESAIILIDEESSTQNTSVPVITNVTSLAENQSTTGIGGSTVSKRVLRKVRTRGNTAAKPSTSPLNSEDDQPLVQIATSSIKKTRSSDITILQQTQKTNTTTIHPAEGSNKEQSLANTYTQTARSPKRTIGVNTIKYDGEIQYAGPSSGLRSSDYKTHVVTVPSEPRMVANKQTMCKPGTATKGTNCRPHPCSVQCQTDDNMDKRIVIPIPIPIYVPQPMYMYSAPFPVPVPIPLPIPVPIFIPTTRNSAEGILKEIKKIQDKMPTDPFEAELLMMAEMVAGEKKKNDSDSDSEDDTQNNEVEYVAETIEPTNSFGEDVLQMALKMATDYDEPAVDLESAMTASTITPETSPQLTNEEAPDDPSSQHHHMLMIDPQSRQVLSSPQKVRKRTLSPGTGTGIQRNNRLPIVPTNKRPRRTDMQIISEPERPKVPVEKPDASMCLKYTFGVNAWKQWVMTKNADLEKSAIKRKSFKSELLQLTADELNYSLCLFVKEVRKPNGSEYAPDTIYYLVLGIQQYLYENGRIDNIFTDPYYERFTDCLDEVAKKFSVLYNDSQYIVTRVEEEHLWECKQLGAHSPHVLLSTLMFFNTKHFNLTTVEEHMQLSFSHIMKHWKRSPPGTKAPGSRNVLLRFYPPQTGPEANPRKKKVYEQQENEDNPLRCPVKLYEFYLSKCPESVKTRNDVFYLQPERSCVPDSPVWYSTQPLSREALVKMLHRVKMVKEINVALLTS